MEEGEALDEEKGGVIRRKGKKRRRNTRKGKEVSEEEKGRKSEGRAGAGRRDTRSWARGGSRPARASSSSPAHALAPLAGTLRKKKMTGYIALLRREQLSNLKSFSLGEEGRGNEAEREKKKRTRSQKRTKGLSRAGGRASGTKRAPPPPSLPPSPPNAAPPRAPSVALANNKTEAERKGQKIVPKIPLMKSNPVYSSK